MSVARRTVEIKVVVDLAKGSKEAHARTIRRIADEIGLYAVRELEDRNYTIQKATVTTLMHYVRHDLTTTLVKPVVRRLKKVV